MIHENYQINSSMYIAVEKAYLFYKQSVTSSTISQNKTTFG